MRHHSDPAALLLGGLLTACAVYTDDSLRPLASDSSADSGSDRSGSPGAGNLAGSAGSSNIGGNSGGKPSSGSPGVAAASGGVAALGGDSGGGEPSSSDGGGFHEAGGEANGGGGEPDPMAGGTSQGGNGGSGGGGSGGGSGGKPTTGPGCSDHPLTARGSWILSASHEGTNGAPENLIDEQTTRFTTGKPQSGDEWLQVDFGQVVVLSQINLQQAEASANDYPRGYAVTVSNTDVNRDGVPNLTGVGKSGVSTTILLPAFAEGRYLLIEQTGSSLSWWSAVELEVSCVDPG
jgi:hypothetical protein